MGFEILPYEDGDDAKYKVFEVTHSDKWVPAQFKDKTKRKSTTPEEFPEFDATIQHTSTDEHDKQVHKFITIPEIDPEFVIDNFVLEEAP